MKEFGSLTAALADPAAAVYDRTFFVESVKYARSQTAPTSYVAFPAALAFFPALVFLAVVFPTTEAFPVAGIASTFAGVEKNRKSIQASIRITAARKRKAFEPSTILRSRKTVETPN